MDVASNYALVGRAPRHTVVVVFLCMRVCVSAETFPELVLHVH